MASGCWAAFSARGAAFWRWRCCKNRAWSPPAHATSIAIILPLSLISLIVYWLNGNLPLTQSLPFFAPALLGSAAGAALLKKIPVQLLKLVFAGLILYSGIRLLMR